MPELNGSLVGIGLPALVQLLSELRETGHLELAKGGWAGRLVFADGQLIDAAFQDARGLEALAACALSLAEATFSFVHDAGPAERTIELGPDEVGPHLRALLAGRGVPGAPLASLASLPSLPSLDAVPHLVLPDGPDLAEHLVLRRGALHTLALINGQRTVRDIVGSRPLLPELRTLAQLGEQGVVVFEVPAVASNHAVARAEPAAATPLDAAVPLAEPAAPLIEAAVPLTEAAAPPPATAAPEPASESTVPPDPAAEPAAEAICPYLGFADDPDRHYPRPTALHRCYATGDPGIVSAQEQRALCLSGRYPTCPRLRTSAAGRSVPAAPQPQAQPQPQPQVRFQPPRSTPPAPAAAGRTAATFPSRAAHTPPPQDLPVWIGADDAGPRARLAQLIASCRPAVGRRPLAIIGGLILASAVLAVVVIVLLPRLRPDQPDPTTIIDTGALPAVATAPPVSVPTPPRPAPVLPVVTATAPPRPTATPTPGATLSSTPPLLDAQFAAGAPDGWLDNPPYAAWRDGAFRLQARDAGNFVAVRVPLADDLANVIVSATLRKTGGPPGGGYGLIVRARSSEPLDGVNQTFDGYVVEVGDRGEAGIWYRDGDHWVDLVPWSASAAVRQGGSPNDVSVQATANGMIFSVNGVEFGRVTDVAVDAGSVGIFVGGDLNQVALDRISVQIPD